MKIKIDGLFGKYTSVVDLSNRCNIIIGENGVGKSTTLKIIYCILNMDFIEITKYNFEIITIEDEKFEKPLTFKYTDFLPNEEIVKASLTPISDYVKYYNSNKEFIEEWYKKFKEDEEFRKKYYYPSRYDRKTRTKMKNILIRWNMLSENEKNLLLEYNKEDSDVISMLYPEAFRTAMLCRETSNYVVNILHDYEKKAKKLGLKMGIASILGIIFRCTEIRYNNSKIKCFNESKIYADRKEICKILSRENSLCMFNMYNTYKLVFEKDRIVKNEKDELLINDNNGIVKLNNEKELIELKNNIEIKQYNMFNEMKTKNKINIDKICFNYYFSIEQVKSILNKMYDLAYDKSINQKDMKTKQEIRSEFYMDIGVRNIERWFVLPILPQYTILYNLEYQEIVKTIYEEVFDDVQALLNGIPNNKIKTLHMLINKYITNKNVFITPEGIKVSNNNSFSSDVGFEYLSEGEKKLILFFLIALYSEDTIMFIDEPETSMSLIWQEQIIPDLLQYTNLKNIIVSTQSPYIVRNSELLGNIVYLPSNTEEV